MRRAWRGSYREHRIDVDFLNAPVLTTFRLSLADDKDRYYYPLINSLHAERELLEKDEDNTQAIWRVGMGIVDNPDQWEFISDLAAVVRHSKALQITADIPVFGVTSTLTCDRAANLNKGFHYSNLEVAMSDVEMCNVYLVLSVPDDDSFSVKPL